MDARRGVPSGIPMLFIVKGHKGRIGEPDVGVARPRQFASRSGLGSRRFGDRELTSCGACAETYGRGHFSFDRSGYPRGTGGLGGK